MVHRMLLVKAGNKYIHLLKMFGALFGFASAFFVFNAAYELSQAMESASLVSSFTPAGDLFGMLTAPIASLFMWLAFLVIAIALYRSDRTVLPLEEDIVDYPDRFAGPPEYKPGPSKTGGASKGIKLRK